MAIAYLDTLSGISGDMTLAALVDAGADRQYLQRQIDSLGMSGVVLDFSETHRGDFRALRLDVRFPNEHAHRRLKDIEAMIGRSQLTVRERDMALRMFRRLGAAEAKVHGKPIEQVHFHEVGAVDSIVDICGIAVAIANLEIERLFASATPTGCGTVRIAHGLVSVPAPATAELLKGIPIRHSQVEAELTTPTGATVLASLVDGFGPIPDMQIEHIGYGAGHKELQEQANLLRVLVGTATLSDRDEVVVLETNIDDITGEQLGFAIEQIWKTGALEVFTTAIGMKKNRPGVLLSVLCRPELRSGMEDCMFQHTGSLGIRRQHSTRRILVREIFRVSTPLGDARVKLAHQPNGEVRIAPEYDDCRALALAHGISLESAFQIARDAAEQHFAKQNNGFAV